MQTPTQTQHLHRHCHYVTPTPTQILWEGLMRVKRVEELEVFKKSHALALELYRVTSSLPDTEKVG